MSETFTVNGETRPWRAQTMRDLLSALAVPLDAGGIAVAVNAEVVPRARWTETTIAPDDRVEIVRIVRGG